MPRVAYAVPQQGFRPKTNPLGALAGLRLRGLGLIRWLIRIAARACRST